MTPSKQKPLVSVIIPVYNIQDYLEECLDSMINQTYKNLEIICINDGSTDNSLNILKEYEEQDKRIIVIDKENEGSGEARNEGIDRATGEWILFVDGDDKMKIDGVETLIRASQDNPCVKIIKGSANYYDGLNNLEVKIPYNFNAKGYLNEKLVFNDYKDSLLELTKPGIWATLIKRMFLIENNLSFKKIKYGEDTEFFFRIMLTRPSILRLSKVVYLYKRDNPNNTVSSIKQTFSPDKLEYIIQIINDFTNLKEDAKLNFFIFYTKLIANSYIHLTSNCKTKNQYIELTKYFKEKILPISKISESEFKNILSDYQFKIIKNSLLYENPAPIFETNLSFRNQINNLKQTNDIKKEENIYYLDNIRFLISEQNKKTKLKFSKMGKLLAFVTRKPIYPKFSKYDEPKISIVGIFYNQQTSIHKWMNSIQNQSLKEIEIILVNGSGKQDNTNKIIQKYMKKDKRIKYIEHFRNKGIFDSRKDGALLATGKYTMFLDGDDYLYKDSCKLALKNIEKNQTDCVIFGADTYPTEKSWNKQANNFMKQINRYKKNTPDYFTPRELFEIDKFEQNVWRTITKTKYVKKALNKVEPVFMNIYDDIFIFILILLEINSVSKIYKNLAVYSFGEGTWSGKHSNINIIKNSVQSSNFRFKFWRTYNFGIKEDIKLFLLRKSHSVESLEYIFTKLNDLGQQKLAFDYYLKESINTDIYSDLNKIQKTLKKGNTNINYIYPYDFINTLKSFRNKECDRFLRDNFGITNE